MPRPPAPLGLVLLAALLGAAPDAHAQTAPSGTASGEWYRDGRSFAKIAVAHDGVYRVTGRELEAAGLPIGEMAPATLQLFTSAGEEPLLLLGGGGPALAADDTLVFAGRRNTGAEEVWAYGGDLSRMSSTARSLFTDTTFYWLGWGDAPGRRYAAYAGPGGALAETARFAVHHEADDVALYHGGDASESGTPLYTRGEGFYTAYFPHGTVAGSLTRSFEVPVAAPVRTGTEAMTVRVRLNGATNAPHTVRLELRLAGSGGAAFVPVDTVAWDGYAFAELAAKVPQDRLPPGDVLGVRVVSTNEGGGSVPNNVYLDAIDVAYTGRLEAPEGERAIPASDARTLAVTGLDASALLLTPGDATWSRPVPAGAAQHFAVGAAEGSHRVATRAALRAPDGLVRATAQDLRARPGADYVVVAPRALRASAERLAAYRASAEGGGHATLVVDLETIYDAFDAGRPTPIALRRFVHAAAAWTRPARYVVLWGDAIDPAPGRPRAAWEVPSFGVPASDGWFAMGAGGDDDWTEAVSLGRLPVRTDAMGDRFVDKVRAYEHAPGGAWQKRALFLAGGKTPIEQDLLQTPTRAWSALAAGAPTGLDTLHFFKNVEAPLDPSFQDSLRAAFHEGAAWLSYFGHSAAFTWEIVTEPPRDYDNAPHLPVVLSLGCYTGNFAVGTGAADDPLSLSEQLVVESLNGGIAHWGASSLGDIANSALLSEHVHARVFEDTVRVLGPALRAAKAGFAAARSLANPTRSAAVRHLLQYGLIGDPATRLRLPDRPDVALDDGALRVTPEAPTVADGALTVDVRLRSFGLVPTDSVHVRLVHTPPSGAPAAFDARAAPFRLEETVRFVVPVADGADGTHRLEATADAAGAIGEADETNNTAVREQTVFATGVLLVGPEPDALVATDAPALHVAVARRTPGPGAPPVTLAFELDTTDTFASPARRTHTVATAPTYAVWRLEGLEDGRTYHWRARVEDGTGAELPWSASAFTVRRGAAPGWSLGGARLGANSHDARLAYDDGRWRFRSFDVDVRVSAFVDGTDVNKGQFTVEGAVYERLGLGFGVLVLDGATGAVKAHGSMPTYANAFEDPAAALDELEAVVGAAADGDWVLVRTRHLGNRDREVALPDRVREAFRGLGSGAIDTLTYRDGWVLAAQRGADAPLVERVATGGELTVSVPIPFAHREGATVTPRIGPAAAWGDAAWSAEVARAAGRVRVEVLADDGTVLAAGAPGAAGRVSLAGVDAARHPYVRLRAVLADSTGGPPPQLARLEAHFTPAPVLGLVPEAFALSADTLLAGAPLDVEVPVLPLAGEPAPGATVAYDLVTPDGRRTRLGVDTLGAFDDLGRAVARRTVATDGRAGRHALEVTLRPSGAARTVNAVLVAPFVVTTDRTPPSFEVRIEGEAMRPDPDPVRNLQDPSFPFVPARPYIEIDLRDDHPFARLADDTTVVTVRLDGRRIPYDALAPVAGPGGNELRLAFEPELPATDSTHTLVVEVRDVTGNEAEGSPYQVHFRTQHAVEIEQVYPYPNPMSTHTVFAFRLRGADVTAFRDLRLRIYTVAGRLVRELDLAGDPGLLELGALRIGWNNVFWDGRDADGDPVGTGVYLYRLHGDAGGAPVGDRLGVEKLVVIR